MRILVSILTLVSISVSAFAMNADNSTEEFLREFHKNPKKMMYKIPTEIRDGKVIDRGFMNSEMLDRRLFEEKMKLREQVMKQSAFKAGIPFSAPTEGDNATAIVDGGVLVTNVMDLDRRGVSSYALPFMLWSDSYWPIAMGLVANRYNLASGKAKEDWTSNYADFLGTPTSMMNTSDLSPAEKYDLLVGDTNMTLTNYSWNRGRTYMDQFKASSVPSWMGICHGWSGATHMHAPIPYGAITLKSANGTPIKFYQSDVKALTSLMWANTTSPTHFVGYRCDIKPPRDGQGRTVDDHCRDNNAGTVYLVLTNQMGLHNRAFVMDATYDAEVWNYTVTSYKTTYYNPQTLRQTDDIRQAIVPVSAFTIDKFKALRAPGTAYVMGIAMNLTHLNEVNPTHGIQVQPSILTKQYVADIELDANYNVIGGEWYSRIHPDFIWSFGKDAQPLAPGDAEINADDWNVANSVPPSWANAARKSSKDGMPLFSVVKKIVEAAPSKPPTNSDVNVDPTDSPQ